MIEKQIPEFEGFASLSIESQSAIKSLLVNGGKLLDKSVKSICQELDISIEELMLLLLPIAKSFSVAPISSFHVGAVVRGKSSKNANHSNLYLGANFEYEKRALNFSIHAEQSAVYNAWINGEIGVKSIATSAAPCGHCRQFLYEISAENELNVIIPDELSNHFKTINIQSLLPLAFGPKQLGCEQQLMQENLTTHCFKLDQAVKDELVLKAFEQAKLSYAPYTQNYAACAIEMKCGNIFIGRNAENAAHNPSLSAFSSAISQAVLVMDKKKIGFNLKRVVLVEYPTVASQKELTKLLLSSLNNDVFLEYESLLMDDK